MLSAPVTLGFLNNLMGMDGLVLLVLGLLIFGSRLPQVGKNLGKTIVEFKKGLSGSYSEEEKEAVEEEKPVKRMSGAATPRVAASTPARKRLPETEEV